MGGTRGTLPMDGVDGVIEGLFNSLRDGGDEPQQVTYGRPLLASDKQMRALVALSHLFPHRLTAAIDLIEAGLCRVAACNGRRVYVVDKIPVALGSWSCCCGDFARQLVATPRPSPPPEPGAGDPVERHAGDKVVGAHGRTAASDAIEQAPGGEHEPALREPNRSDQHCPDQRSKRPGPNQPLPPPNRTRPNGDAQGHARARSRWTVACCHLLAAFIIDRQFPVLDYSAVERDELSVEAMLDLSLG